MTRTNNLCLNDISFLSIYGDIRNNSYNTKTEIVKLEERVGHWFSGLNENEQERAFRDLQRVLMASFECGMKQGAQLEAQLLMGGAAYNARAGGGRKWKPLKE